MIKLNLITEGFVKNVGLPGHRLLNPEEMDQLLEGTGSILVSSGSVISLEIDLGFMHSVSRLVYKTSPLDTSNLVIKYGRTLDDLTEAAFVEEDGEVIVVPNLPDYNFPRYFTLTHTVTEEEITLNKLVVENTEEEIDFGEDGNQTSATIVSPITGGHSDVVEVKVVNSGSVTSDIFVSVDSTRTRPEVFERLELSSSPEGGFRSLDPVNIPEHIPWEWGNFENCSVNDNNELEINSSFSGWWSPSSRPSGFQSWGQVAATDVRMPDGSLVMAKFGGDGANQGNNSIRLMFLDPSKRTLSFSSDNLPYSIANSSNERLISIEGTHFCYDGTDNIYWLRGVGSILSSPFGDKEIYRYSVSSGEISLFKALSTESYNSYYGRGLVYNKGYLYILGGRTSQGGGNTTITTGNLNVRLNIETGEEEMRAPLPINPEEYSTFRVFEDFIYYTTGSSLEMWRYDINSDTWSLMPASPSSTQMRTMAVNERTREVWVIQGSAEGEGCESSNQTAPRIYRFSVDSLQWNSYFDLGCGSLSASGYSSKNLEVWGEGLFLYFDGTASDSRFRVEYLEGNPSVTESRWTSPVLTVRQGNDNTGGGGEEISSYYRILIDRIESSGITMEVGDNLSLENFQVRASNSSPAGDNTLENFTSLGIDLQRHVVGNTGGVVIDQNFPQGLQFNHVGESNVTTGFLYLNQEFSSGGIMQYKFWWRPPGAKSAGDQNDRSGLYIVPFLDTLNTGLIPSRDNDTLRRNSGDYFALRLGSSSDTSNFSQISLFKGGGSGTGIPEAGRDDFTISPSLNSSSYHEIVLTINWDNGDYKIRVSGKQVGQGNIPLSTRNLLQPLHSVEIYSSSTGVGTPFTEYFRYLTVSRVNLEARQDSPASPLHLDDPLYGLDGSLEYIPVTVNQSILPASDYLQFRMTFKAEGTSERRVVSRVVFPPVIKLSNVEPGKSKSVYLRYNFPSSNSLIQEELFLKAYMVTDKE